MGALPSTVVARPTPPTAEHAGPTPGARRPQGRLGRARGGVAGLSVLAVLAVLAVTAPLVAPQDPLIQNRADQFRPPSLVHPFGTDEFGRDILSRVIYGARISLVTGALAVLLGAALRVPLRLLRRFAGGGDAPRGRPLVPRPRHATPRAVVGQHAQHGPVLPLPGALVRALPRPRHHGVRPRPERRRRRPPGRRRPRRGRARDGGRASDLMARYVVWRLAQLVPVLFLASIAVWLMIYLIPGDPAIALRGGAAPPVQHARGRGLMGPGQPLPVQYVLWLGRV